MIYRCSGCVDLLRGIKGVSLISQHFKECTRYRAPSTLPFISRLYPNSRISACLPSSSFLFQALLHKPHRPKSKQPRPDIWQSPTNSESNPLLQGHDQDCCYNGNYHQTDSPEPSKPHQHASKWWTGFISLHHSFSVCKLSPRLDCSRILKYSQQCRPPQRSLWCRRHWKW